MKTMNTGRDSVRLRSAGGLEQQQTKYRTVSRYIHACTQISLAMLQRWFSDCEIKVRVSL